MNDITTPECIKLFLLMAFPMLLALTVWGVEEKLGEVFCRRKAQRTSYSDFDEIICDDEF